MQNSLIAILNGKPSGVGVRIPPKLKSFTNEKQVVRPKILRGESLCIDPCDGSRTLSQARKNFRYIDPNFTNFGLHRKSGQTGSTHVDIRDAGKVSDFSRKFLSLSADLGLLRFTQSQIIRFVEKYPERFHLNSSPLLFLFMEHDRYFVTRIQRHNNGLHAHLHLFGVDMISVCGKSLRFVTPRGILMRT